jgi:hypothetical protein
VHAERATPLSPGRQDGRLPQYAAGMQFGAQIDPIDKMNRPHADRARRELPN